VDGEVQNGRRSIRKNQLSCRVADDHIITICSVDVPKKVEFPRGSVIQRTTMELPRDELERMIFFEDARKRAEMDHEENPEDAQVPRMNACSSRFSDIFHELTSFSRF
jgi:hypothetical protein